MLKVVIDTNLLINGSQDEYNYSNRIIDLVLGGTISAYANPSTLSENRLLVRKRVMDRDYAEKLEKYFNAVNIVQPLPRPLKVVEDIEDNKLVEAAVAAQAEYLISSDMHLLKLVRHGETEIVDPAQFWTRHEEDSGGGWQGWIKQFIN